MTAEDLLTRTLHEVTDHTDYPSTSLAAVQARARAGRARTRRTSLLAAAAAVALVAGSTALWVSRSTPDSSPRPSHELSSGPTSSPTPVALSSLLRGRPPGVDYVRGSDYVSADGHTTRLPLTRVTEATPYLGGFLVAHGPGTAPRLTWLDNRLRPQWTTCGNQLTLSADRTQVAYLTEGCGSRVSTIHLGIPSGMSNTDQTMRVHGLVNLVGLARGAVVYSRSNTHGVWVAEPAGAGRRVPGLSDATAVDPTGTTVAGQSAADSTTGELVDLATGHVLWRHAGYLVYFSPDGKYLLAESATDAHRFQVLDATTGRDVGLVTVPEGLAVTSPFVWGNDDTLLTVLRDRMGSIGPYHEAIARFDLHGGRPTLATPVLRLTGQQTGYVLAAAYF